MLEDNSLLALADQLLYRAKKEGRVCVCVCVCGAELAVKPAPA